MRIVLFLAIAANSVDLVATALGIHWLGNREGNPLLAALAHQHWLLFVAIKGVIVPLLIVRLYRYRAQSPWLATSGMALVIDFNNGQEQMDDAAIVRLFQKP